MARLFLISMSVLVTFLLVSIYLSVNLGIRAGATVAIIGILLTFAAAAFAGAEAESH